MSQPAENFPSKCYYQAVDTIDISLLEQLHIRPDGIYVDGTLGGGGHSYEICRRLSEKGRLVGIDQDADAIEAAGKRLEEFRDRVTIVRSN